jgi:CDP-diacylglycerol--glycerol-3-phosphate 3-phosphatidyltransferase
MNLPNALTLLRIFIVPLLVVVILTNVSENVLGKPRYIVGLGLFVIAALTDLFDGMIARRWKQVSKVGKLLDPIADKLLISAALISLVEHQLAPAWAVVVIVGREFAVTGLRSIAATDGVVISASAMGKFKMVAQVVTVGLLILSISPGQSPHVSNFGQPFPAIQFWTVPELRAAWSHLIGPQPTTWNDWQILLYTAGRAMLWVVVISSIYSMWGYFRAFFSSGFSSGVRRKQSTSAGAATSAAATAQFHKN